MLTDLIELGQKMKKQMKDTQSEIKQNIQETNSDGKPGLKTGTQINGLDQKEERNFNKNRMRKQELKKMKRGLGNSKTTLNVPTSES